MREKPSPHRSASEQVETCLLPWRPPSAPGGWEPLVGRWCPGMQAWAGLATAGLGSVPTAPLPSTEEAEGRAQGPSVGRGVLGERQGKGPSC